MAEAPAPLRIKASIFYFEVDHHQTKDVPVGVFICSPPFSAGGYDWVLYYYPHGREVAPETEGSHVSLFLSLQSNVEQVEAEFSFKVFDITKRSFVQLDPVWTCTFDMADIIGTTKLMARDTIEQNYCLDGSIYFACSINVINGPKAVKDYPGGLCEQMEKLLEKGETFDVTFEVEGETIPAHKLILAARSEALKEKFNSFAAEPNPIKIDGMTPGVFKDLLYFIYTDKLVSTRDVKSDEYQFLLEAANRYGLEKLSLLCEEKIADEISVETVIKTMVFADNHQCARLKRKCLDFATDGKNFEEVALTEDYLHEMGEAPELFVALKKARLEKKKQQEID